MVFVLPRTSQNFSISWNIFNRYERSSLLNLDFSFTPWIHHKLSSQIAFLQFFPFECLWEFQNLLVYKWVNEHFLWHWEDLCFEICLNVFPKRDHFNADLEDKKLMNKNLNNFIIILKSILNLKKEIMDNPQPKTKLKAYKIVFVGPQAAGKSSILNRIVDSKF